MFHSDVSAVKDSPRSGALNPSSTAPSLMEVLLLAILGFVLFIGFLSEFRNYLAAVDNFGDSAAYISVARAIHHWDFQGLSVKHFWGLPYAMAAVSTVSGLSEKSSLLLISCLSSLASVILAYRLWGAWVAAFFATLNFDWLQRSLLGGSEPLSVALLFGTFLAVRKERWLLASALASLSTLVRPLSVFALLGIGLYLLWKREYRKFAISTAIGLGIGIAYAVPLAMHFGDPFATVHSYVNPEWSGGWLFGVPFYAIIKGTIIYPAPWTNLVLSFGWIGLVLAAIVAMIATQDFRRYARAHPVEILFAAPFLWCLFTYNYPYWARGEFPRFAIPVVPLVLVALYRWIPKDRRVMWAAGLLIPVLAAASAIGIRNVADVVRRLIG